MKSTSKAYIGTTGGISKGWRGRFYPFGLAPAHWLSYLAERFDTVEVNSSFYSVPKREVVAGWDGVAPGLFRFALKLWRAVTHYRRLRGAAHHLERFFVSCGWIHSSTTSEV